jgi:hypothetical protein
VSLKSIVARGTTIFFVACGGGGGDSGTVPPVPPPNPDRDTGAVLAFHDFDDGTLGPYTNPWASGIDFPTDPTGSGRGNVARLRFAPSSGGSMERAVTYNGSPLRYGATMWMKGDVYLPSSAGGNPSHNRKLIDFQGAGNPRMTLHRRDGVLRLSIVDRMNGSEQEVVATTTGISLADNTWHTIEVRITTNSADNVRDGVVEIYMNGSATPTYRHDTGIGWITERHPGGSYFDTYLTGFQLTVDSGDPAYAEYRYWDNISFSTTR